MLRRQAPERLQVLLREHTRRGRENEMHIRVDKLGHLAAAGAAAAGIAVVASLAEEILQKGERQREGAPAVFFVEENGVRHAALVHHADERPLDLGIPLHLRECHTCLQIV